MGSDAKVIDGLGLHATVMVRDDGLTAEQHRSKVQFIEANGTWHDGLEALVQLDHGFVDAIRDYVHHPSAAGPLGPKEVSLLHVAVNAAPTLLYREGIRRHVEQAFDNDATVEELTEVVEIVFILGIHAISTGVPVLIETAGLPETFTAAERAEHERLEQVWTDRRGFWTPAHYDRMVVDPGHFEAYLDASAYPWEHGVLDPKVRELVYVTIDGSPTHLFESGLGLHVEQALEQGATRAEVVQALQIAGSIGLHSVREAMPVIAEEARRRGKL